MNIWTNIADWFEDLWNNHFKPDLQSAEEIAESAFSAAISDAKDQLGIVGMKIISDGVAFAEALATGGADKRAAALQKIGSDLVAAAIQVPQHVVNAFLEAIVSKMNAAKVAAAQQPSEPEPDAGSTDTSAA